jgi:hypothetical protein
MKLKYEQDIINALNNLKEKRPEYYKYLMHIINKEERLDKLKEIFDEEIETNNEGS